MKQQVLIYTAIGFVIFSALILGFLAIQRYSSSQSNNQITSGQPSITPLPSFNLVVTSPEPIASPDLTPATIIIPRLNITTAVEPVGQTKDGYMDVPKNANNIAWYSWGTKPSEPGNAVFAGHYDRPDGKPAILFNIAKLTKGDQIETISSNGVHAIFTVNAVDRIPYDKVPEKELFEGKTGKNLDLVTCGGVWDKVNKNYSHRIIVYSSLKEVK